MPKLTQETNIKNRADIEKAALRCFIKKGYNGVSVRDIATAAEVSLGNLYNYYPDKLSIFVSVLKNQSHEFLNPHNKVMQYFAKSDFPNDLKKLGLAIMENVDEFSNYFKLMYVDVVEFDGRHIRELFSDLDTKFNSVLRTRFHELGLLGPNRTIDPCFALTAIYMTFYQYFTLSKVFKAKNIYGKISDEEVIDNLIYLFNNGIARKGSRA